MSALISTRRRRESNRASFPSESELPPGNLRQEQDASEPCGTARETQNEERRQPESPRPGQRGNERERRQSGDGRDEDSHGGSRSLLKPKASGSGYVAAITMGVHRS